MYLVKVSVRKPKQDRETAVECPSFFHEADSIEEVREYVDENFRHICSLYVEYIPDDSDADEDGLPIQKGLFP